MKRLYLIMCSQIFIQNTFLSLKTEGSGTETKDENNVHNNNENENQATHSTEGVKTANGSLVCFFRFAITMLTICNVRFSLDC